MTAKAKLNNGHGFWNFNLGHAITIALLIVSTIGLYFKLDSRLSAVELRASETWQKLERVDEHGTRRSQSGLAQEMELLRSHTNRIDKLEEIVGTITPKIEKIDTNVQWIINQQTQAQIQLQQQENRQSIRR